jgi:hypothetical protein
LLLDQGGNDDGAKDHDHRNPAIAGQRGSIQSLGDPGI